MRGAGAWRVAGVAFRACKRESHGLCKQRGALKLFYGGDGLFLCFHDNKRLASSSNLHTSVVMGRVREGGGGVGDADIKIMKRVQEYERWTVQ